MLYGDVDICIIYYWVDYVLVVIEVLCYVDFVCYYVG